MKDILLYSKEEWQLLDYYEKEKLHTKDREHDLSLFLPILRKAGIKYITVAYEGCGDDGEAYDCEAFLTHKHFKDRGRDHGWNRDLSDSQRDEYKRIESKNRKKLDNLQKKFNSSFDFKTRNWHGDLVDRDFNIQDILVSSINYDWYNNEGGSGTVILNVENETIEVDGVSFFREEQDESSIIQLKSVVKN